MSAKPAPTPDPFRRRHAEYFLALAEELEPAMWGEEGALMGRLQAERDNFRAALSWSLERDAELCLRLAAALRWFWYRRGQYGEGRRWLDAALVEGGRAPPAARARALHAAGWLAHDQTDMDRVEAVAEEEEGVELSETAEIESSLAASFRNLLGEVGGIGATTGRPPGYWRREGSFTVKRETDGASPGACLCRAAAGGAGRGR